MINDIMNPLAAEGQHTVRITTCGPGQVINATELFAMKRLADEEARKVERIRALWDQTYRPQTDSGDCTDHEGC